MLKKNRNKSDSVVLHYDNSVAQLSKMEKYLSITTTMQSTQHIPDVVKTKVRSSERGGNDRPQFQCGGNKIQNGLC